MNRKKTVQERVTGMRPIRTRVDDLNHLRERISGMELPRVKNKNKNIPELSMRKASRSRLVGIALGAAGAGLAFFGVRSFLDWRRGRMHGMPGTYNARREASTNRVFTPSIPIPAPGYQPHDQPDRIPVPATGAQAGVVSEFARDTVEQAQQDQGVSVREMVRPLVEHLMGFHRMLTMLRERRSELGGKIQSGARSLTPGDRFEMQETFDRLDKMIPDYGEGNLPEGSLQERIYHLTVKVRDALQNLDYNDDDLFRLNGEVKPEACRLLREIQDGGLVPQVDLDPVLQRFE